MKIAIVTVGRSDYGILRPLMTALSNDAAFDVAIIAGSAHLCPVHGSTGSEIAQDGFNISKWVSCSPEKDSQVAMAKAIGAGVCGFAEAYEALAPDCIILLGDRFETIAAALAAQPLLIPVAHIGGGAVTKAAIDDTFRHVISQLSAIHFVETAQHAKKLMDLGIEEACIYQVGALGLDNIDDIDFMSKQTLEATFGLSLDRPPVLVTIHPETRNPNQIENQSATLFSALETINYPIVITYPNSDAEGLQLIRLINAYAEQADGRVQVVPHFGTRGYFSMMREAQAMIGNSSSGIIEAGAFGLPVVDLGDRQAGRVRGPNVCHAPFEVNAISLALSWALRPETKAALDPSNHPYGHGGACVKISKNLKALAS